MEALLKPAEREFFGHPRGLATLFFTELWERFSYYGMRALLILFMTAPAAQGGLGLSVATAGAIYGLFTAMVYLLSLPGGWLADRLFGQRRAVLLGGILIAAGNFLLVVPSLTSFFAGLALIAAGTGLLKPNISTIVGQLYLPGDSRRDAGFSIFYMGINLGAFLAPLACGYLGQRVHWRLGFALAGLGMTVGAMQYVAGGKHLAGAGLPPGLDGEARRRLVRRLLVWSGAAAMAGVAMAGLGATRGWTLSAEGVSNAFGFGLLAAVCAIFAWLLLGGDWTPLERRRLAVVGVLFAASTVFWGVFEQAGSTLNLFAQRSVDKRVLGFEFPASWLQSLNSLFIIALAPVFAWLWVRLGEREPSSPAKFVLGLVGASAGFALLVAPAAQAEAGALVSPWWLVGTYLLHTCGELCLSPVGLSVMTKLAPPRAAGFLMGVWFLSLAVGNYLGGRTAALYERLSLPALFGAVAAVSLAAGLLLALLVRPIKKLMGGVR